MSQSRGAENPAEHTEGNTQGKMHGEQEQNGGRHNGQGEIRGNGEGKNRQTMSISQKLQNVIMFLGMILSCTMITYWIAIPKKKKIAKNQPKDEKSVL